MQFSVFLLCMSFIIFLLIHKSTDDTIKHEVQDLSNEQMKCPIEKKPKDINEALVALATFPGSGTTWIRYLIEESTGCFTGRNW